MRGDGHEICPNFSWPMAVEQTTMKTDAVISRRILIIPLLTAVFVSSCSDKDRPPDAPVVGDRVVAVNGTFYRQGVTDTAVAPALQFAVDDADDSHLPSQWIYFTLLEGDGTLSADSAKSDSTGLVSLGYDFSGSLGHAVVRAASPGLDSLEVTLRHDRLVPGQGGQGQYLLLGEDYGTVKRFNGPPDTLVVHPTNYLFIADYEKSLGVVFVLEDVDWDDIAHDSEPIVEIIVNDNEDAEPDNNYQGKAADSVGIGSNISAVISTYGETGPAVSDLTWPPYWRYQWPALGLTVYTSYQPDVADRDVREIHLANP